MNAGDLALIGHAVHKAAECIERESPLGSEPRKVATVLRQIADGMQRRFFWKGDGRYVEQFDACAGPGCNDFGIGAAGWLVWQSQVDPKHEMALPLCRSCADKARRDPAFVREIERLYDLPPPLRFVEVLK